MVRTAASMSAAVRSGIFAVAISSSWARVTLPTLFGVRTATARLVDAGGLRSSTAAGGVLVMKVKLRSEYTVMTTGIGRPCFHALRLGVERLAELHDVHAVLAQCGTDRRTRDWPALQGPAA